MTQLEQISGRGWRFDDDKEAAGTGKSIEKCSDERLVNYLDSLPVEKLEEIDLSGNSFGLQACRILADRLAKCEKLSVCRFNDMFTGRLRSEIPLSLEFIVQALQGKPVRLLDLSDNAFGPDGLRPLVPLISRLPTLQVLRLHNTGLGPQGGQLLAEALSALAVNAVTDGAASAYCDAPVAKGPLRELVVGRSRLENGSMAQLASALRQHPQLQVLVLPQNGIRPEGIVTLASSLADCRELRQLDLQDNTLTEKGAIALAAALPHWRQLETLNIGDCLITARGFRHLLPAIERLLMEGRLKRLNLQYNELNTESLQSLMAMLKRLERSDDDEDELSGAGKLSLLEINGNGGADLVDDLRDLVGDDVLGSTSDMEEEDEDGEDDDDDDDEEDGGDEDNSEDDAVNRLAGQMATAI